MRQAEAPGWRTALCRRTCIDRILHDPAARDPRGFIVPSDQLDFLTATKFVNTLIKAGVVVHRATAPFTVAGKAYPAGSYVVKSAQAFRAHVMDMFEPQDHPNDFEYPGGPPCPPYDVTGYTLSYSMGVVFDRVLDGFDGPFEPLKDVVSPPPARFSRAPESGAYLLRHEINDAFVAVNRLLKSGADVSLAKAAFTANGRNYPAGTFVIAASAAAGSVLESLASEKGLPAESVTPRPAVALARMRPKRVGLWDQYGGSMPSGWTRWLLEQFEFPFEVVYPRALDEGGLSARFDVLIFVDGGIPARDRPVAQPRPEEIPGEYHDRLGAVTIARTLPHLKKFVEDGGVLLTIGSSTSIAASLGLPVRDALTENGQPLPAEKFYIPGSLLEVKVDVSHPLAYGLPDRVKVFFDEGPAFQATADRLPELATVAWFDSPTPLRSGWAWGQKYLDQAAAVIDARLGAGHLLLFGPEIAWRAQPHGTFKFLFNGIYYSEKAD